MKNIKKLDMNEFAKTCLEYDLKSGVLIKVGENNVAFAHDIEDDDFDNVNTVEWMLNWYATDAFEKADYSDTDLINGFDLLKKGLSGEIEMADSATYAF